MASGLKYNTSALHRSYATSQAYDMADRMRANRQGLVDGVYNSLSDSSTVPDCGVFGSDSVIKCDPGEMAQYDVSDWNNANARLLPEGEGNVSLKSNDPESADFGIYTITISWNDDRDSDTTANSFIVEFQP